MAEALGGHDTIRVEGEGGEKCAVHGRRARDDGRGSKMRKTVAVVGLVAFVLALGESVAVADGDWYMKDLRVHWKSSVGCTTFAGIYADSAQKALGAVTDTSAAISTKDIAFDAIRGFGVVATAAGVGRVYVVSPNTTANVDTLNFAIQASYSGSGDWFTVLGLTAGQVAGATTVKSLGHAVTSKDDGTLTALRGYPYIRFIEKIVTGTFTAAELHFVYPAYRWMQ